MGSFFTKVERAFDFEEIVGKAGDASEAIARMREAYEAHDRPMTSMSAVCSCWSVCECPSPEESITQEDMLKWGEEQTARTRKALGYGKNVDPYPALIPSVPMPDIPPMHFGGPVEPAQPIPPPWERKANKPPQGPPTGHTSTRAAFRKGGR